jgi:hypothetical protein
VQKYLHEKQEIPEVAGSVVLSSRGWVATGLPEHNHNHERDSNIRFSEAGYCGLFFPETPMLTYFALIFQLQGHFLYIYYEHLKKNRKKIKTE